MREELSKILSEVNSQDSYLKALHRHASIDMLSGLLNRAAMERSIKSCKRKHHGQRGSLSGRKGTEV